MKLHYCYVAAAWHDPFLIYVSLSLSFRRWKFKQKKREIKEKKNRERNLIKYWLLFARTFDWNFDYVALIMNSRCNLIWIFWIDCYQIIRLLNNLCFPFVWLKFGFWYLLDYNDIFNGIAGQRLKFDLWCTVCCESWKSLVSIDFNCVNYVWLVLWII